MADLGDHFASSPPVALLPVALLLQRVDDFLRHVALVVLGEHGVGLERAAAARACLRRRRPALRGTGPAGCPDSRRDVACCRRSPRSAPRDCRRAATLPGLTSPPRRMRAAGRDVLLDHVGRRIEEHDRIAQRAQHQRRPRAPARRGCQPIRTRRRCLRVMLQPSSPRLLDQTRRPGAACRDRWRARGARRRRPRAPCRLSPSTI